MRAERIKAGLSRILDARTAGRLAAVLCIVLLAIMPLVPAKTTIRLRRLMGHSTRTPDRSAG